METDTFGKIIPEFMPNCDCGLTGGCEKYRPKLDSFIGCIFDEEANKMKRKLQEWEKKFNKDFERWAKELNKLLNN